MHALYRMPFVMPTLVVALLLLLLLGGCEAEPPQRATAKAPSNVYLEAMQEAEAVKHSLEQRNLEQQRIDQLIGRGQAQPPSSR